MIRSLFVTVFSVILYTTYAQQAPIAIVSASGTTRLTSTLDSAAILVQDNDIIYLPGGTFTGMSTNFTKKVTVFGVGHNPDSTAATGRTYIAGNISFYAGAEGSVLDGVYCNDNVYVSNNVKIYRCNVHVIYSPWNGVNPDNVLIEKCVIRGGVYGIPNSNVQFNTKIKNSIFNSGSNFSTNMYYAIYENNVFLNSGVYYLEDAIQCTFKNNTFTKVNGWGNNSNSFFQNNVFGTTIPPLSDPNNASGNYVNQHDTTTFMVSTGLSYDYTNDYKIKNSSPGHNGGTDGKDVGIYGGVAPWVKGNIPPNPHIRTKNVDAATGSGGLLRVRFDVRVQQ